MSLSSAVTQIWNALVKVMVVDPLLAGLWLLAAFALAVVLLYGWQRLLNS